MLLFSVPRSRASKRATTCAWPVMVAGAPAPRAAAAVEAREGKVVLPAVMAEAPEEGCPARVALSVVLGVVTLVPVARAQRAVSEEPQETRARRLLHSAGPSAPVRIATTRTVAESVARLLSVTPRGPLRFRLRHAQRSPAPLARSAAQVVLRE